jgi:hypothetical protein
MLGMVITDRKMGRPTTQQWLVGLELLPFRVVRAVSLVGAGSSPVGSRRLLAGVADRHST